MCIAKASSKLSFRALVVAPSLISKTLRNKKKHKGNVIFLCAGPLELNLTCQRMRVMNPPHVITPDKEPRTKKTKTHGNIKSDC